MMEAGLSADTEVVLLLCGRFGGERKELHAPLSPTEYGELARWLKSRELRPADMLTEAARTAFGELIQARLDRARIEFLLSRGTALALALERWQRAGLWVVSRGDAAYPQRYRQAFKHGAPPLLFGVGEQSLLERGGLAVVGARQASEDALSFTAQVGICCARDGVVVVSGGARGVDSAAMQAATEAGGLALGVLACDLLKSSMSRSNRSAIQAGRLGLISPFSPEAGFNAGNAMARNRLIYALADWALVVDSTRDAGGTWAGATENLRHGWVPLFVRVPDEGGGNAALLANGARVFDFDPKIDEGLLKFLGSGAVVLAQDDGIVKTGLVEPANVAPVVAALHEQVATSAPESAVDAGGSPAQFVDDAPTPAAPSAHYEEPPADSAASPAAEVLDMYPVFISRVQALVQGGMKTEGEVARALGLDSKQAKVWLKQATEQGRLKKIGRAHV